jgi:hypothetical protein
MHEEAERIAQQIATDVSKGLVSYDRARKQLAARAKTDIFIGEVIEWLDQNIKRFGYEDDKDKDVVAELDHTHYYDESKTANREIMAETREYAQLVNSPLRNADVSAHNQAVIDVSSRVKELVEDAEKELGIE